MEDARRHPALRALSSSEGLSGGLCTAVWGRVVRQRPSGDNRGAAGSLQSVLEHTPGCSRKQVNDVQVTRKHPHLHPSPVLHPRSATEHCQGECAGLGESDSKRLTFGVKFQTIPTQRRLTKLLARCTAPCDSRLRPALPSAPDSRRATVTMAKKDAVWISWCFSVDRTDFPIL